MNRSPDGSLLAVGSEDGLTMVYHTVGKNVGVSVSGQIKPSKGIKATSKVWYYYNTVFMLLNLRQFISIVLLINCR